MPRETRALDGSLAVECDGPGAHRDDAHDAAQQGRLADTVAPEQHRAGRHRHIETDIAQNVAAAVILIDRRDVQHCPVLRALLV